MPDTTIIKGNNNLVIDFTNTPIVALTCTDNFANVWSEINVTLMASGIIDGAIIYLPQITTLYPLTTQINFTTEDSLISCSIIAYNDRFTRIYDSINGLQQTITLQGDNSTIPFSSGLNNNWFVPALFVSKAPADQPVKA
jgi:hypothetical protein